MAIWILKLFRLYGWPAYSFVNNANASIKTKKISSGVFTPCYGVVSNRPLVFYKDIIKYNFDQEIVTICELKTVIKMLPPRYDSELKNIFKKSFDV